MRFCNLGSGSAGNASLVEASQGITQTRLLIDCGFSERELTRRLARASCAAGDISAIFITHEHGDHAGCALAFAQRHRVPLWTSRGTWRAIGRAGFDPSLLRLVQDGQSLPLGDMELHAFTVPHDANEPLQLHCSDGARKLGVLTDLGTPTTKVCQELQHCDALLLECNHDETMLRASSYHASLKKRILGSHGHLSNALAAELLQQCLHSKLQWVAAAHLSERNNHPSLATAALAEVLNLPAEQIPVALQAEGLAWLDIH